MASALERAAIVLVVCGWYGKSDLGLFCDWPVFR